MIIIEGKNGSFCGNQEFLYCNIDKVHELVERYSNLIKRKKLRIEIKSNIELAKKHIAAFELVNDIYGLSLEQEKCFRYIKRIYAKKLKS